MSDEIEIEWIPEDTGAPYEVDMTRVEVDTPAHIIDKWCKKKYGHTNWAVSYTHLTLPTNIEV